MAGRASICNESLTPCMLRSPTCASSAAWRPPCWTTRTLLVLGPQGEGEGADGVLLPEELVVLLGGDITLCRLGSGGVDPARDVGEGRSQGQPGPPPRRALRGRQDPLGLLEIGGRGCGVGDGGSPRGG